MWKSLFQRAISSWIRPQTHRANPPTTISKELIPASQDESEKCLLFRSRHEQEDDSRKKERRHTCHGKQNILHNLNCGSFLETFGWVGTVVVLGLNLHELCWKNRSFVYPTSNGVQPPEAKPALLCGRICNLLVPFAFAMPQQRGLQTISSDKTMEGPPELPPEQISQDSTNKEKPEADEMQIVFEDLRKVTLEVIGHLENLDGVKSKDRQRAFIHFKNGAKYGDPKAHFNLGVCYETGHGTQIDFHKAAKHYGISARAGHLLATYNLGVYYLEGKGGLPRDEAKGLDLIEKAAKQGLVPAQTHMGIHFTEQKDWKNAFQFLKEASSQDPEAQYYLGLCYENGWGVTANRTCAIDLYQRSAASGNTDALYAIGHFFKNNELGLEKNFSLATSFYQMAEAALPEMMEMRVV